jgi:hypothetical protein
MKDSKGNTIWDHEYKHFDIHEKWWNDGKEIVDPMEGWYCSEKCAIVAVNIINLTMWKHIAESRKENAEFDKFVYGNISSKPEEKIKFLEPLIATYIEKLNKQKEKFKGCGKL